MRKISLFGLLLIQILLGISTNATAQNDMYVEEPRLFYGGVIAGGNFTQVDGDRFAGYHKAGINVGGIVYAQLAHQFAASIEILYSQKGSRAHKSNTSVNRSFEIEQYKIDLQYAEVPLMLNYFDRRKSHFGAGVSYSQLVSAKEILVAKPAYQTSLDDYPFRKSDLNFIVGGNLHLFKGLFLNARFQYSIYSIRKKFDPELGRAQQFNNLWTVRLMYLF